MRVIVLEKIIELVSDIVNKEQKCTKTQVVFPSGATEDVLIIHDKDSVIDDEMITEGLLMTFEDIFVHSVIPLEDINDWGSSNPFICSREVLNGVLRVNGNLIDIDVLSKYLFTLD